LAVGPIELERYWARHVEPYTTAAFSFDMPLRLLVAFKQGDTVRIYKDDNTVPFFERTFDADYNGVLEIGTADIALGDHAPHRLRVEVNGAEIARIPARWYSDEEERLTFRFMDENGNQLLGKVAFIDLENNVMWSDYGSSAIAKVCEQCYVEFLAVREDGMKYYVILKTSEYSGQREVYVYLRPRKEFDVVMTFRVRVGDARLYGPLAPVVREIADFGGLILEHQLRGWMEFPLWMARRIMELLGIRLRIKDVRVEYLGNYVFRVTVVVVNDLPQLIVQAIAAAIVILSIAALILVENIVVVEQYRTERAVVEWQTQYQKMYTATLDICRSMCGNDAQCFRECMNELLSMNTRYAGETADIIKEIIDELNKTNEKLEKWKTVAMVVGVVLILLLLWQLRGGGVVVVGR